MRFASFFSGVGGFEIALESAGHECVFSCEVDSFCEKVYEARFGRKFSSHDIKTLKAEEIPDAEIWCGGFPCQDLSVAGKRGGIHANRSGLVWRFLELAKVRHPRWILLENVPGLLSSQRGGDFALLLRGLQDLGYVGCYRVLDAQHFGVPQRRSRVFVVGSLGVECPFEVLFESSCGRRDIEAGGEAGAGASAGLEGVPGEAGGAGASGKIAQGELARALGGVSGGQDYGAKKGTLVANAISASAGHHGHSSPRGDGSDNLVSAMITGGGDTPGSHGKKSGTDRMVVAVPDKVAPVQGVNMQGNKSGAGSFEGKSPSLNAMHGHDVHAVAIPSEPTAFHRNASCSVTDQKGRAAALKAGGEHSYQILGIPGGVPPPVAVNVELGLGPHGSMKGSEVAPPVEATEGKGKTIIIDGQNASAKGDDKCGAVQAAADRQNRGPMVAQKGKGCLTPWDAETKRIHDAEGKAPTVAGSDGGGGQRTSYVAQKDKRTFSESRETDVAPALTHKAAGIRNVSQRQGQTTVVVEDGAPPAQGRPVQTFSGAKESGVAAALTHSAAGAERMSQRESQNTVVIEGGFPEAPLKPLVPQCLSEKDREQMPLFIHLADANMNQNAVKDDGKSDCLDASGPGAVAIPIDIRNATRQTEKSDQNRQGLGVGRPGDPAGTLTDGQVPAIAIDWQSANGGKFALEGQAHQIRTKRQDAIALQSTGGSRDIQAGDKSLPLKVGSGLGIPSPPAIAFAERTRDGERNLEVMKGGVTPALTNPGAGGRTDAIRVAVPAPDPAISFEPRYYGDREKAGGKPSGTPDITNAKKGGDSAPLVAFAQNQRNEVRDLGEKAGALAAEPGMKQQTYLAETPPTLRGYGHSAQGQHNDDAAGMMMVRRLSPTECVPPDTLLLGDDKAISDYHVGETVISGTGLAMVKDTMRRRFKGSMVEVKTTGLLPIRATPEHPILVCEGSKSKGKWGGKVSLSSPVWKLAGDLKLWRDGVGDFLLIPRLSGNFKDREVDLRSFVKPSVRNNVKARNTQGLPSSFRLDADGAWLLGLYVAEGCASVSKDGVGRIEYSFGKHEGDLAVKTQDALGRLGFRSCQVLARTALKVSVSSSPLARALLFLCGHGARNKRVPECVLLHEDLSLCRAFLDGYMAGDGYTRRLKDGSTLLGANTASRVLALQLQLLIGRLGRFSTVRRVLRPVCEIEGRRIASSYFWCVSWRPKDMRYPRHRMIQGYIATPIRSVSREDYDGDVCNIETSDNTYLVSNAVVHNCERLQGFEDGHTCLCGVRPDCPDRRIPPWIDPAKIRLGGCGHSACGCKCSDSARYRAMGNAIAIPVVRWIADRFPKD